jgi:flagellar basal body-associated protein FliL
MHAPARQKHQYVLLLLIVLLVLLVAAGALQRSIHKLLQAAPAPATISAATVVLPSPFKEQPAQRWNIPEQVVEGSQRKGRPQRGKAAAAAAAVEAEEDQEEEEVAAGAAAAGGRRGSR